MKYKVLCFAFLCAVSNGLFSSEVPRPVFADEEEKMSPDEYRAFHEARVLEEEMEVVASPISARVPKPSPPRKRKRVSVTPPTSPLRRMSLDESDEGKEKAIRKRRRQEKLRTPERVPRGSRVEEKSRDRAALTGELGDLGEKRKAAREKTRARVSSQWSGRKTLFGGGTPSEPLSVETQNVARSLIKKGPSGVPGSEMRQRVEDLLLHHSASPPPLLSPMKSAERGREQARERVLGARVKRQTRVSSLSRVPSSSQGRLDLAFVEAREDAPFAQEGTRNERTLRGIHTCFTPERLLEDPVFSLADLVTWWTGGRSVFGGLPEIGLSKDKSPLPFFNLVVYFRITIGGGVVSIQVLSQEEAERSAPMWNAEFLSGGKLKIGRLALLPSQEMIDGTRIITIKRVFRSPSAKGYMLGERVMDEKLGGEYLLANFEESVKITALPKRLEGVRFIKQTRPARCPFNKDAQWLTIRNVHVPIELEKYKIFLRKIDPLNEGRRSIDEADRLREPNVLEYMGTVISDLGFVEKIKRRWSNFLRSWRHHEDFLDAVAGSFLRQVSFAGVSMGVVLDEGLTVDPDFSSFYSGLKERGARSPSATSAPRRTESTPPRRLRQGRPLMVPGRAPTAPPAMSEPPAVLRRGFASEEELLAEPIPPLDFGSE
jgi:hypothetical protein